MKVYVFLWRLRFQRVLMRVSPPCHPCESRDPFWSVPPTFHRKSNPPTFLEGPFRGNDKVEVAPHGFVPPARAGVLPRFARQDYRGRSLPRRRHRRSGAHARGGAARLTDLHESNTQLVEQGVAQLLLIVREVILGLIAQ